MGLVWGTEPLGRSSFAAELIKAVGGYDRISFEPLPKFCLRDSNPRLYVFLVLDDLLALKHGDAKPLHLSHQHGRMIRPRDGQPDLAHLILDGCSPPLRLHLVDELSLPSVGGYDGIVETVAIILD